MLNRFYSQIRPLVLTALVLSVLFLIPTLSLAAQATLAWDPNVPAPEGYRLFQRTEGQTYDYSQPVWTGSENTATVIDLAEDITHYFIVRAYAGAEESADSGEVSFLASTPPLAKTYTIAVNAGQNGSISPGNLVTVNEGTNQSFTFSPDSGYHIVDVVVDGVSKGALPAYTFSQVSANHTINASFAVNTYTISASPGVNGSISPASVVNINHGGSQTFTITPHAGYHVADVKVDGLSKGPLTSYTFNQVTANRSIEATFSNDTYTVPQTAQATLAWDPNDPTPEGYRIYQRTEGQNYDYNQHVWAGSATSCTVYNLDHDTTYYFVVRAYVGEVQSTDSDEVSFLAQAPAPASHTIAVLAGSNGAVSPANTVTVSRGADQSFLISPDSGYHVADVKVDGISVGVAAVYTFSQVSANHTLGVSFAIDTYTISASAGTNGSISSAEVISVDHGASRTYTITATAGYQVADVLVDGVSMGAVNIYTFDNIIADHTIGATFSPKTFTIAATAGGNGAISPSGSVSVDHGTGKTYTITPNAGYQVADVLVDGVSMGAVNTYTFDNIASDHSITVSFAAGSFTISASAGVNGSVMPAGTVNVDRGASKTYAITPDAGYHVADVKVDGVSLGSVPSYTFSQVSADHTINATFAAETFDITATAGENGNISPSGIVDATFGGSQRFTFSADSGFHIADVQVDGQSMGAIESYTFTSIDADHTLEVTFAENALVEIWIEAEDGDLQWPMEIADDESAGAGGFVWVPAGTGNLSSPSEQSGYVEYRFDVPETGDYVIWGRQISNDTSSDSFFVSVDGQEDMVWHTKHGGQDIWTWDVVSIGDAFAPDYAPNPMHFRLEAGIHTLRISQREDGTKLDRILITNQTDLTNPEPDSVIDAMEFGDVQVNHNWTRVTFEKPFVNPVVVTGPISLNGGQPAVVRIQHVDAAGFEIRLQEWEYLDGTHAIETVSYIVMEQGLYTLEDGTKIEAANIETSAAANFQEITFSEKFNVAPVVTTAVISYNDSDAVTGRMKQITVDGFKYRMQEQEANTQDHGTEKLAYIAWEPSSGAVVGITYLVEKTADAVKHKTYAMMFEKPFTSTPVFLADMQTTDGGDTANIRCKNRSDLSVDVWIDEEQSKDTEVNHTSEVIGYMAFSR